MLIGKIKNIAVFKGAVCTSAVIKRTRVLIAMGVSTEDAFASIRFSLGRFNTEEEVKIVVKTISELIQDSLRYA